MINFNNKIKMWIDTEFFYKKEEIIFYFFFFLEKLNFNKFINLLKKKKKNINFLFKIKLIKIKLFLKNLKENIFYFFL
jgi:hypothetical protein